MWPAIVCRIEVTDALCASMTVSRYILGPCSGRCGLIFKKYTSLQLQAAALCTFYRYVHHVCGKLSAESGGPQPHSVCGVVQPWHKLQSTV